MPPKNLIETAATRLWDASATCITCDPIRELIGDKNLDMAYAIQTTNIERRLAAGARIVGRKIGLTAESVQQQLGVDQPDYGMLLDTMEVEDGGVIPWQEVMQPKVEAEIAFVLSKDLNSKELDSEKVLDAIDHAVASIEVVGSRIEGWNIRITDTIADNASASHFVIGNQKLQVENIDLINCEMILHKNGEQVATGKGSDCMGSPINAILWLAKAMVTLGTPLKSGDIILSGACGPMAAAAPGDSFRVIFDDLGEVSVSFSTQ